MISTESTVRVTARRWEGGWEFVLDDGRATQGRVLAQAPQVVRDFLDTDEEGIDHSAWVVDVRVELDDFAQRLDDVRSATAAAAAAQIEAARRARELVGDLRSRGLSVSDCAALLGVSRGRITQLLT